MAFLHGGVAIAAACGAILAALVLGHQMITPAALSRHEAASAPSSPALLSLWLPYLWRSGGADAFPRFHTHRSNGNSRHKATATDGDDGREGHLEGDSSSPPSSSSSPHKNDEPWTIRPSPGKGLGMFATRPIPKHSPILTEAPQFVIVPPSPPPGRTGEKTNSSYLFRDMLARIQTGFDGLSAAEQARFLACHEHRFPHEPEVGRLLYIFRSNAYAVASPDVRDADRNPRWGMFPRMARINHACRPNVANLWVEGGLAVPGHQVVWATRDIGAGEELVTSYVRLLQDTAARQASLRQYGFQCDCPVCRGHDPGTNPGTDPDTSTDDKRRHAGRLLQDLHGVLLAADTNDTAPHEQSRGSRTVVVGHHLQQADALIRFLNDETAGHDEHGGLAGYLPRAYHIAGELARLAAEGNDRIPEESVYGPQSRRWAAEKEALMRQIEQR